MGDSSISGYPAAGSISIQDLNRLFKEAYGNFNIRETKEEKESKRKEKAFYPQLNELGDSHDT